MADFPIITSPDGSTSINVGSVMLADGVDYGMAPMFSNVIAGNPLVDGGVLGARWSGPRTFKFPLRLATVGALTPAGVSRALRQIAQPGAYIDLVLAGVATADAVRFDIIDGRVRESQDVKMWQGARRRDALLELDVQPFGYLPTWITLASSASVGLPGTLAIPGASILGDVPGLAQINVMTTLPSQQLGAAATYGYDAFFYALGNKAPAWITAASLITDRVTLGNGVSGSIIGDAAAPGSQLQRIFMAASAAPLYNLQLGFQPFVAVDLNPSYFGRYRLHAFARLVSPSYGGAIPLSADVAMSGPGGPTSMASGGPVASVGQPLTLNSDGAYMPVPTGFAFYPLGDITVPTIPAGLNTSGGKRIRVWGNVPSHGVGTISLDIAGLWLQSLDGAQGVITRDLQVPNVLAFASYGGMFPFSIDAYQRDVQAAQGPSAIAGATLPGHWLASQIGAFSMLDRYRGPLPQLSPSVTSIEVMAGARLLRTAYRNEVLTDVPKVWWRFNEPSGASIIIDYSGQGLNGAASNLLLGASSLLYGEPGGATGATGFAFVAGAAIPNANAPRTLEAWFKPATYSAAAYILVTGASEAAGNHMALSFRATSVLADSPGNAASWAYAWKPGQTYHVAAAYSGTYVTMYVNGQALATQTFPVLINSTARANVGNTPFSAAANAPGGIDEVAIYASSLSADRILAHYIAGRNTMGATSPPVFQKFGYAGVSLRYQPRFAFSKEI